jgi:GTP pyrophosphokinase
MPTERLAQALAAAIAYHDGQVRKTNGAPYVCHPIQVAGIALEYGADEDQAIAALLHDVLEDTDETKEGIAMRFGDRVAALVEAASDAVEQPKPPWRERKETYLASLPRVPPAAGLVIASDKLHNARSLAAELDRRGDEVWEAFQGGKDGTLWYYRALLPALRGVAPAALVDELEQTIRRLHGIAGVPFTAPTAY